MEGEEENQHAQSLQHQEDFFRQNMERKEKKFSQRKSKRSSMKAIAQSYHQGMGPQGRKKKSRNNSRKSKRTKKNHTRRISSQLEETPQTPQYQQKMVRSQIRPVHSRRQMEEEMARQRGNWNMQPFDQNMGTPRNPDFVDRRRQYKMRQLRSSREMERVPMQKRIRQSYEQNYVPDEIDYEEHWRRTQQQKRKHPQYISEKEAKSRMNFDYGNINANVRMQLPFE